VNLYARALESWQNSIRSVNPDAMDVPFIANHDTDRAAGYLSMANGRMQMAASLYLLSPGSPFIYYGEEIGLRGSRGGASTDANRRLAMLWGDGDTVADPAGSTYDSQTPYSVKDLEAIPGSLLYHYRRLLALRRANPEIARGTVTALSFPGSKAGGFLCELDGSVVGVFHNTSGSAKELDLSAATDLAFSEITFIGEGEASLEGSLLALDARTSAILR
jgi:glycosidase